MDLNKKRLSKSQRFNILSEHFDKGTPISELARINKINPVTIYNWKKAMGEKPKETLDIQEILLELENLKKENNILKKVIGNKEVDLEICKDIIEFLKKKEREDLLISSKNTSKKI
jgi:putative transposase